MKKLILSSRFVFPVLLLVISLVVGANSTFAYPSSSNTTTTITSSLNPSTYGSSVTFTATVTHSGGSHTPSGSVTIKDGSSTICTDHSLSGNSSSVTGSCSTSSLSAGNHSITAAYSGDDNFNGSTSSNLSQVVNKKSLTVTGITASDKTYNGNTAATISTFHAHLSGVINNDDVDLHTSVASGTFSDKNVGHNKTVNISGLTISGSDSSNYSLTQPTTTADITTLHITVTAVTDTKTHDGNTSSVGIPTVSPSIASGDTANFIQTFDTADVGTGKTLTPSGTVTDGNSGNNYSYTFHTNNTGVINAAPVTTYTLTYTTDGNGTITGTTPQTVDSGTDGTAVTATPNTGYQFASWSDGILTASRTDTNVTKDISVTANFTADSTPSCNTDASNTYVSDTTNTTFSGDDSTGTAVAVIPTSITNTAWTANIPGATWIWSTSVIANPTISNTETFTRTFNISGTPLDSSVLLAADNTYSVSVNGAPDTNSGCVDTTGTTFNSPQTCDIPASMLSTGENTLAITVVNTANPSDNNPTDNPAGLLYSLAVNENDCLVTPTTYTLTYTAGTNGSLTGNTSQTVNENTDGTAVTAVADSGYHFVDWSDSSTDNPRTDTSVTGDISVTANFAADSTPPTPPTFDLGNPATDNSNTDTYSNFSVVDTNNPASMDGYVVSFQYYASNTNPFEFILVGPSNTVEWISPTITPSGTGVQTYSLTTNVPIQTGWNLGAHFDLTGTVPFDSTGTLATYTPNNDGTPTVGNPLDVEGTSNRTYAWNATLSATAPITATTTYTLTYTAGTNGSLTGNTSQTVNENADGTAVTAVADSGYHFVDWSDSSTDNPRTDTSVTSDISVTANFAADIVMNTQGHTSGGGFLNGHNGGGQVLGAETFKFTEWMSITKGWHASEVPELQQRLTAEGFYTGPISGTFDEATKTAVEAYQTAHPPLKVDGIVGPKTRAVLNS